MAAYLTPTCTTSHACVRQTASMPNNRNNPTCREYYGPGKNGDEAYEAYKKLHRLECNTRNPGHRDYGKGHVRVVKDGNGSLAVKTQRGPAANYSANPNNRGHYEDGEVGDQLYEAMRQFANLSCDSHNRNNAKSKEQTKYTLRSGRNEECWYGRKCNNPKCRFNHPA